MYTWTLPLSICIHAYVHREHGAKHVQYLDVSKLSMRYPTLPRRTYQGASNIWPSRHRGTQPRDYLSDRATSNAQSTRLGARPWPELAPWCTRRPPPCHAAESMRKGLEAGREKLANVDFFFLHVIRTIYPSARYMLSNQVSYE